MALSIALIALEWEAGSYRVYSQVQGRIDVDLLEKDGVLRDVSQNSSYLDEIGVVSRPQLERYLSTPNDRLGRKTRDWYASLPSTLNFILIHRFEW